MLTFLSVLSLLIAGTSGFDYNAKLRALDKEIQADPRNFLPYFKRATTYIQLGKSSNSIADFTKVLELKPDFDQALLQRGKLYLKDCQLEQGINDLTKFVSRNPADTETEQLLEKAQSILPLVKGIEQIKSDEDKLQSYTDILGVCSSSWEIRSKRADLYIKTGDKELAIGDLLRSTSLKPDNIPALSKMAELYKSIGELEKSVDSLRSCLKLDPEYKACKKAFRSTKILLKEYSAIKTAAERERWGDVIAGVWGTKTKQSFMKKAEEIESERLINELYQLSCKAYGETGDAANTLKSCGKALESEPESAEYLMYRAEAKLEMEEYDDAMRDFQAAHEKDRHNDRIRSGYHKAQRLQRQASRKDYYKILGVSRKATKREIKKAFRKLAQEWHPDKYSGDLPKEAVAKKMSEINEAYETLTNDELRERFDNGDDPNDPHGGHGGHGFHGQGFHGEQMFQQFFQGGGFPFGGGGHFKFQYGG